MKDYLVVSYKIVYNYIILMKMFEIVGFEVVLFEYCDENGWFYYNEWDVNDGVIFCLKRYDFRNKGDKFGFLLLIVDVIKC